MKKKQMLRIIEAQALALKARGVYGVGGIYFHHVPRNNQTIYNVIGSTPSGRLIFGTTPGMEKENEYLREMVRLGERVTRQQGD